MIIRHLEIQKWEPEVVFWKGGEETGEGGRIRGKYVCLCGGTNESKGWSEGFLRERSVVR